jgi:plastocyanin
MRRSIVLTTALLLALAAVGCGGNGDEAGPEPPITGTPPGQETTLRLTADPGGALTFDQTSLAAPAGTITIELVNESSVPHNVAVEGEGLSEESPTVTGESTSLTVELEAGTYTFFCSVPGHREAGMEGTLAAG